MDYSLLKAAMQNPYFSKKPRVEFYEKKENNPKQRWWWKLWFSSDEVAASSEGYSTRSEAVENFKKIEQHIKYLRENYPSQLS